MHVLLIYDKIASKFCLKKGFLQISVSLQDNPALKIEKNYFIWCFYKNEKS